MVISDYVTGPLLFIDLCVSLVISVLYITKPDTIHLTAAALSASLCHGHSLYIGPMYGLFCL